MTDDQKAWIDNASYEQLLRRWRFAPLGTSFFQDEETVAYFSKVMNEKRTLVDHVAISKKIGWR